MGGAVRGGAAQSIAKERDVKGVALLFYNGARGVEGVQGV